MLFFIVDYLLALCVLRTLSNTIFRKNTKGEGGRGGGYGEGRRVFGSLSFDVKGRRGWGVSPDLDPFGQTEKSNIFHGCHKCMVPNFAVHFASVL